VELLRLPRPLGAPREQHRIMARGALVFFTQSLLRPAGYYQGITVTVHLALRITVTVHLICILVHARRCRARRRGAAGPG
jgi:hypothetical protein